MKILSNDYKPNIPGSKKKAKGGPANFARLFTNYILDNTKHQWIGLIIESSGKKDFEITKLFSSERRTYYHLRVSKTKCDLVTKSRKKRNPEIVFKEIIRDLANFIKKLDPDIIFLNGFNLNNWLLLKAGKLAKIPIAIQHAGIWFKEIDIHKNFFPATARKTMKGMERDIVKSVSCQIFLNEWSKEVFEKEVCPIKKNETAVIPLPIARAKLMFKNTGKERLKKKIGVVSRWDKIKNYEAVLNLAKEIEKRNLPWEIYSVISIPKTKRNKKLKQEYKKFVNIEPLKNRKEMSAFYEKMDLIIVPSHFDVSPHVVPESLFHNRPALISPNVGWADEYKKSGAGEWIVNFDNVKEVIEKIKKIKIIHMPKNLSKKIKEKSNPNLCFKKYLNIFKKSKKK